jgi:hypothetical protein
MCVHVHVFCLLPPPALPACWNQLESEPGWLFVSRMEARHANVSVERMLMTCGTMPLQRLLAGNADTISPSNAPAVVDAPIRDTAGFSPNTTIVELDFNGFPVRATPGAAAASQLPLSARSTDGVNPLRCVARSVHTKRQLLKAMIELQSVADTWVTIQITSNLSLGLGAPAELLHTEDAALWPHPPVASEATGLAMRVFKNVTWLGRRAKHMPVSAP